MFVLSRLHLVLKVHLELVLLLEQRLVLGPLAVEFALELVGEILDLLVHVEVLEPELVLALKGELVDLHLELVHPVANVFEVSLGHENLLRENHPFARLRRTLHHSLFDVKHGEDAVVTDAEEEGIVEVDAHARHRAGVALQLLILLLAGNRAAVQSVNTNGAGIGGGEELPAPVGEPDLCERGAVRLELLVEHEVLAVELLQGGIGADAKDKAVVGRDAHRRVLVGLEHILFIALERRQRPLVHGAVQAGGDEPLVISGERDAGHLAAVPAAVAHVLAGVHVIHLDHRAVHRGEVFAAVAERALAAALDAELAVRPDVVHEQVAQPELVGESHQHVQAARVERHAGSLLREKLDNLVSLVEVIPHANRPVAGARHRQGFTHAQVHARHALRVVSLREQNALDVLALHHVDVGHVNLVRLVIVRLAEQRLVRRGQRERRHPRVRRTLQHELLHASVQLLLVGLLVDANGSVRAAADETGDAVRDHAIDTLRVAGDRRDVRLDLVQLDHQQLTGVRAQHAPLASFGPALRIVTFILGIVREPTVRGVILFTAGSRARLGRRELDVRERTHAALRAFERAKDALAGARRERRVVRGESHLKNGAGVGAQRFGGYARELLASLPVPERDVPLGCAALRDDPLAVGREGHAHVLLCSRWGRWGME